jgi:NADH-quinone oxidoreductase subunit N
MDNINSVSFFIPELFLTAAIMVVIIVDLAVKNARQLVTPFLTIAALLVTTFLAFNQYEMGQHSLFFGMIVLDPFSIFFKMLVSVVTIMAVFISMPRKELHSEYYTLLLIINLGMYLMVSASDLLMILIALEIVGLSSYVLAGIYKTDQRSSEASLKYVLYGAASTGIMAFGMSLLYGMTGETNLFAIQKYLVNFQPNNISVLISVILILAGFGYKIAMVPFHFWVPDVYEGAPTPITAFFSVAPKAAGIALLARFMVSTVGHQVSPSAVEWLQSVNINAPMLLAVLSVATMTLGNLIALKQTSVKRMMAYSSIAHAGYILMAFVVFNKQGYEAVMIYSAIYFLMNFGAFWIIDLIAQKLGSEEVSAYHGLALRAPFVAVAMAIFMFSLTGLPPLAGFIGKFYLFAAIINEKWYWLAVAGAVNSVISLYYYAGVAKAMFLTKNEDTSAVELPTYEKVIIAVLVVPTVLFGVYWSPLLEWTSRSISIFSGN